MLEIDNRTDFAFDVSFLEQIAQDLSPKALELIIVDDQEIAKLNKLHRGIDKPTDVLSFPLEPSPGAMLGSIVISSQRAQQLAKELGHSPQEELALLFIHGLLHLLGYDHERDQGQMRQKEEELIRRYNLPPSLIVRNE
ncbi:MAG: rRNA maturation RNase YbeY [Epsilonproteobacteria bacterium]|nr:rRNA maturation RNase YbeY [Campylobacterota bacterium]NPA65134.1 rRNA maturation RNase YbeY [Campylobacterota bacterium]